jgi:hypothetical protein
VWGNVVTWLHLPVGQHMVLETIDPEESAWRLPMLLAAAEVWSIERREALRRFRHMQGSRPH